MNKNNDLKAFFSPGSLLPFCRCSAEPVQLAPDKCGKISQSELVVSHQAGLRYMRAVSGVAGLLETCWEILGQSVSSQTPGTQQNPLPPLGSRF